MVSAQDVSYSYYAVALNMLSFCINEVIMLYNSALDHSIAYHKITCTRLLCTAIISGAPVNTESRTQRKRLPISATAIPSKNQPDQANSVRYITKAKRRMQINLADSQGNDE